MRLRPHTSVCSYPHTSNNSHLGAETCSRIWSRSHLLCEYIRIRLSALRSTLIPLRSPWLPPLWLRIFIWKQWNVCRIDVPGYQPRRWPNPVFPTFRLVFFGCFLTSSSPILAVNYAIILFTETGTHWLNLSIDPIANWRCFIVIVILTLIRAYKHRSLILPSSQLGNFMINFSTILKLFMGSSTLSARWTTHSPPQARQLILLQALSTTFTFLVRTLRLYVAPET